MIDANLVSCRTFVIFLVMAVVGGTQSLIDGSYEYYHYLQDRFDDNVSSFSGNFNFLAAGIEQRIMNCTKHLKSDRCSKHFITTL